MTPENGTTPHSYSKFFKINLNFCTENILAPYKYINNIITGQFI